MGLPAADCFLLLKEIYRIPQERFKEALGTLVEALGVQEQLHTQIRRLSLGERMKMELIAALLHDPKVVFLDEPTIGLDLTAQRAIRDFILTYSRERQPAILLTSHYMEDIERLCHRIVIIREGEFVYDGPLTKIAARFSNDKVITAKLDPERSSRLSEASFPTSLGQLLAFDSSQIKVKVSRSQVPEVASLLLRDGQIADLSIEEVDISELIESLIREGAPQ